MSKGRGCKETSLRRAQRTVLRCSKESAATCACRRGMVAKNCRFDGLCERCCGIAKRVRSLSQSKGICLQRVVASTGSANGDSTTLSGRCPLALRATELLRNSRIFIACINQFWGVAGLCKGIAPQRG